MPAIAQTETDAPAQNVHVFLSYSRKDRELAEGLRDRLLNAEFSAYLDLHDIAKGEAWQERLRRLIEAADAVLFLISPSSVTSEICDWEVNEAERLSKRIFPVVVRATPESKIPRRLQRLNFTFLTPSDQYNIEVERLIRSLSEDSDWIRDHTRLLQQAVRWSDAGRAKDLLLRGRAIEEAESWRDRRASSAPELSALHKEFLSASRQGARRRQQGWITGLAALVVVIAGLALVAYVQRNIAIDQRLAAESRSLALRSDAVRATAPEVALDLAMDGYDRKATDEALGAVRRSIDQVALLKSRHGLRSTTVSGNGAVLGAVDEEGRIRLFDAETLDEIGPGLEHRSFISELAMSARGRFLAAADGSDRIQIWDLASGGEAQTVVAVHEIDGLRFGQTDEILAAIGGNAVTFFALPGLKHLSTVDNSIVSSQSAVFSPSDDRAVLVGRANVAAVVDPVTGAMLLSLDQREEAAALRPSLGGSDAGILERAYFRPDGKRIITTGGHALWSLWDALNGRQLAAAGSAAPMGTQWLLQVPETPTIVAGISGSGELWAWNLDSGSAAEAFGPGHDNLVHSGAVRPDGKVVATVGGDKAVALWSVAERRRLATYHSALPDAYNLAFAPSGERLVTFGPHGVLASWNVAMVTPIGRLDEDGDRFLVGSFSEDGSRLVTLGFGGTVTIWDGFKLQLLTKLTGNDGRVNHVAINSDGTRIATAGDDDPVRIWDAVQGVEIARFSGKADSLSFDPSGSMIGISDYDGHVRVIALRDGQVLSAATFNQDLSNAVTFSPDGHRYVVTGNDATAIIAATDTAEIVQTLRLAETPFRQAAFGPEGNRLFTTHDDNVVRAWDIGSGRLIAEFRGHSAQVVGIRVSLDGALLLSHGDDDTVRLWNAEDGAPIRIITTHQDDVLDAGFAGEPGSVLSVDRQGNVYRNHCDACLAAEVLLDSARGKLAVLGR